MAADAAQYEVRKQTHIYRRINRNGCRRRCACQNGKTSPTFDIVWSSERQRVVAPARAPPHIAQVDRKARNSLIRTGLAK